MRTAISDKSINQSFICEIWVARIKTKEAM